MRMCGKSGNHWKVCLKSSTSSAGARMTLKSPQPTGRSAELRMMGRAVCKKMCSMMETPQRAAQKAMQGSVAQALLRWSGQRARLGAHQPLYLRAVLCKLSPCLNVGMRLAQTATKRQCWCAWHRCAKWSCSGAAAWSHPTWRACSSCCCACRAQRGSTRCLQASWTLSGRSLRQL